MPVKSANNAFRLDKIALVTGAGRGIGRTVALALAAARCASLPAPRSGWPRPIGWTRGPSAHGIDRWG
jgi:hypothetical protein